MFLLAVDERAKEVHCYVTEEGGEAGDGIDHVVAAAAAIHFPPAPCSRLLRQALRWRQKDVFWAHAFFLS
jgi:hypothetical protein